jgi:hypothetical protein
MMREREREREREIEREYVREEGSGSLARGCKSSKMTHYYYMHFDPVVRIALEA